MKRIFLLMISLSLYYCASAQFMLAGDTTAPGLIIRHPDTTIHVDGYPGGPSYSDQRNFNLDLNKDGTDDLEFTVSAWGSHGGDGSACSVRLLNNNVIRVSSLPFLNDSVSFVDTLNFHDTIGAENKWFTSANAISLASDYTSAGQSGSTGVWNGISYKYIGIGLINGVKTYYGWIKILVSCSHGADVIINNCAVESPVGATQDRTNGVNVKIYPQPVTDFATVELEAPARQVSLTLLNLNGQTLFSTSSTGIKTRLDFRTFESGIYLLKIEDGIRTRFTKIMK
jgi:hypothetical protein